MRRFALLIDKLDESTKTNEKVLALKDYFDQAPDKDKVWTIALFSGKRPRRTITTSFLRESVHSFSCLLELSCLRGSM